MPYSAAKNWLKRHRRLLYTAVTRAQKKVILVGNTRGLTLAVKRREDQTRLTSLGKQLLVQSELSLERYRPRPVPVATHA